MSYQKLNEPGGDAQYGGYGQGNSYDNNPYDQRGYNNGGYASGNYDGHEDVEMQPVKELGEDPNEILNQCQEIHRAVDELGGRLRNLQRLQQQFLNRPDNASLSDPLRLEGDEIMQAYRALADRLKRVKSKKESGSPRNAPQVGRVDRLLKTSIQEYQRIESQFRKDVQEAQARQYRIVRPDATEDEIKEATEGGNQQIFQQALLQSDRRGQAQSTLSSVRARHEAIQNIAQTMSELAQLFEDLNAVVVQQEEQVEHIEVKGEEVHDNVVKANTEIGGAIVKARSARRKKWWCLLVALLIIIVIVIIVVIVTVLRNQSNK